MHMMTLHTHGSGNPLGVTGNADRLPMHPYFIFKDLVTIFLFFLVLSLFVFYMPNALGHSDNYIPANPMQTPPSIVPEWYLLPYYAILRSIPNKLLGVVGMLGSLLILLAMPILDTSRVRGSQFRPLMRFAFWAFVTDFFLLMYLGSCHAESPYIEVGAAATVFYFGWFLIIVPVIGIVENTLMDVATDKNTNKSPLVRNNNRSDNSQSNNRGRRNYNTSSTANNPVELESNDSRLAKAGNSIRTAIRLYSEGSGTAAQFQELANGFFQAEGSVTVQFHSQMGLSLYPVMSLSQVCSEQAVQFFVRLYYALDRIGTMSLAINDTGNIMITFRIKGWDNFFNCFMPYFTMLYGLKFLAIQKMQRIYELVQLIKVETNAATLNLLKLELVTLVYSLTSESANRRLLSFEEFLFNNSIAQASISVFTPTVPENGYRPSFLWIMGFFLGDGSLFVSLKWLTAKATINVIPTFTLRQAALPYNIHFMELISAVLTELGISNHVAKDVATPPKYSGDHTRPSTIAVIVDTIAGIIGALMPALSQHSHFLYWKTHQFNVVMWLSRLMSISGHLTLLGLRSLINYLFAFGNIRDVSLSEWLSRLDLWLARINNNAVSGQQHIIGINDKDGKRVAWRVKFPAAMSLKMKNFQFTAYGGEAKALEAAARHRDDTITQLLKDNDVFQV